MNDPDAAFFARLYADGRAPWAEWRPRPALVEWLDSRPDRPGATALVVACGYGDDAEELARRGYAVRAFDVVPAAIGVCRERFPGSPVDYRVADLFALPAGWEQHDLVVEIQTVQSLPLERRAATVAAIAATVGPGGELFVRAAGRGDADPVHDRPWPVSRAELRGFTDHGLRETTFTVADGWFHVSYRRP